MHTLLNQVLSVPHFILMFHSTRCTLNIIPAVKLITPGHIIFCRWCHTILVQTDMRHFADGHPRVQFDHDVLHVNWVLFQVIVVIHIKIQKWTPFCIKYVFIWVIMLCLLCPDAHQLVVIDCEIVVEPAHGVGQDQVWLPYAGGGQVDEVDPRPVRWVPGQAVIIPT